MRPLQSREGRPDAGVLGGQAERVGVCGLTTNSNHHHHKHSFPLPIANLRRPEMLEPGVIQVASALADSPVAVALVNKIADLFGWASAPSQEIRMAKAQTAANLIMAQGDLEVQALIDRAATRSLLEDVREQEIIEKIVAKTIPALSHNATPATLDNDWLANLLAKCRNTSDEEMQNTWARILAGEANSPGSFSRKTINIVADLERADAEQFVLLCRFAWTMNGTPIPLTYDLSHPIYGSLSLNHNVCMHLADLGLIQFMTLGFHQVHLITDMISSYQCRSFKIEHTGGGLLLNVGKTVFTEAGEQLLSIVDHSPMDGFCDYVIQQLGQQNIQIYEQ